MTAVRPTSDDPAAPFGTNHDGSPIAPYGLKADGVPRRSNSGRRGGKGGSSVPRPPSRRKTSAPSSSAPKDGGPSDQDKKDALISLTDTFVTTGMVMMSMAPGVQKFLGPKHSYALAGDAVIVDHFMPAIADGAIAASEKHPWILSWLDGAAEKVVYVTLIKVAAELGQALISNHREPRQDLAMAGQRLAWMNMAKMAQAVAEEADAMGVPDQPFGPPAEASEAA